MRLNWAGLMSMTRMYWGPSGRMMRKSRLVVNWMAARVSSSIRSFCSFNFQNSRLDSTSVLRPSGQLGKRREESQSMPAGPDTERQLTPAARKLTPGRSHAGGGPGDEFYLTAPGCVRARPAPRIIPVRLQVPRLHIVGQADVQHFVLQPLPQPGSSTGKTASMRRKKLRGIQSGLPKNISGWPPFSK